MNLCHPFVDFSDKQHATPLFYYSDASLAKDSGFGVIYNERWMYGHLGEQFIETCEPSIEYLELYALCIGIFAWNEDKQLNNSRVILYCNNQAVVHMVNKLTSKCPKCMHLIRLLVLDGILHNRKIVVKYVKSKDNVLADSLSRLDLKRFWKFAPQNTNQFPDPIPKFMWPVDKVWTAETLNKI